MDEETKDVTHQKQHPENSSSGDQLDPNNDSPYAQHYIQKKYTQQTGQST